MEANPPARSILIVEDDRDITEMLALLLPDSGFEVSAAENGAEALGLLTSGACSPDVILLDLMMPVMTGWEFRSRQLADPELAAIPVVVMTGIDDTSAIAAARPDAWVAKPIDLDDVIDAARRVL